MCIVSPALSQQNFHPWFLIQQVIWVGETWFLNWNAISKKKKSYVDKWRKRVKENKPLSSLDICPHILILMVIRKKTTLQSSGNIFYGFTYQHSVSINSDIFEVVLKLHRTDNLGLLLFSLKPQREHPPDFDRCGLHLSGSVEFTCGQKYFAIFEVLVPKVISPTANTNLGQFISTQKPWH